MPVKKKVKVYRDKDGQYLKLANGRKVRIKSKRPLTERELIKFLVKYLKPKRKTGVAKLKGVKHVDKNDVFASSKSSPIIDTTKLTSLENKIDRMLLTALRPQRNPAPQILPPQILPPAPKPPQILPPAPRPPPLPPRPPKTPKPKPQPPKPQPPAPQKKRQPDPRKAAIAARGQELQEAKQAILDEINAAAYTQMKNYDYNKIRKFFGDVRRQFKSDADKNTEYQRRKREDLVEILVRNGKFIPTIINKERKARQAEIRQIEDELIALNKEMTDLDKVDSKYDDDADSDDADGSMPNLSNLDDIDDDDDGDERKYPNAAAAAAAAASGNGRSKGATGEIPPSNDGMTDAQLNDMMKTYPEYIGTIAHNEIPTKIIPNIRPHSRGCFIINTDPAHKSGRHWQAVFYDARPSGGSNSIEFYDSYADAPTKTILQGIKHIVEKLDAPTYLKYKENKIVQQNDRSSNCGYFCAKFLMDRLRGKPFSECSGYDESVKAEKNIEQFKKQHKIKEFPYIGKNGKGIVDFFKRGVKKVKDAAIEVKDRIVSAIKGPRQHGSPAVRKFLEKYGDEPIIEAFVARKPLASMITKVANWLTNGVFDRNKQNLGYDDIYHLYLVVKLQNGLYVRVEKNHVVELQIMTPDPKADQVAVAVKGDTTLNSMFQKGEQLAGSTKFWTYHPITNNCQYFIRYLLKGSGMWNGDLEKFVLQDAQGLVKDIEKVGDTAASITDVAGRLDVLLRGRGNVGRR